jgi:putative oxidoreductase
VVYGWNKLQNPTGWQDMITGLGFPAGVVLSWFVLLLELVGGAALIVGLLVRPIALLFAIEMVVSSVTVKLSLGFAPPGATGIELDLALLASALALVILGSGRLCRPGRPAQGAHLSHPGPQRLEKVVDKG